MNMYGQIESNKRKSILIMLGFWCLTNFLGLGIGLYYFDDLVTGMVIINVATVLYMLITIKNSTSIVMKLNKAKKITEEDNRFIYNTVSDLSIVARIKMPTIYIIDDMSPNAFAIGLNRDKGSIALTKGLIEKLNREEIQSVVAHELAHISNEDSKISAIVIALMSLLLLILDILFYIAPSDDDSPAGGIIILLSFIFIPILGEVLKYAMSRNREYLADATAVEYCRNPNALISALRKISEDDIPLKHASKSCANIYFDDPFKSRQKKEKLEADGSSKSKKKKKKVDLFSTHPPVEDRILRLENM